MVDQLIPVTASSAAPAVDADKVKPKVAPKPAAPKAEVLKTETPKVETKEETNQK